jgi:DNA-binding transcriptional MocR family regulator
MPRMNAPIEKLPAPSRYQRIAEQIDAAIDAGALRGGDRLPSVRQLSEQHQVSLSTAVAAYRLLEDRLRIEARPKSGYYVATPLRHRPAPSFDTSLPPTENPQLDRLDRLSRSFIEVVDDVRAAPPFCARPARRLVPEARLQSLMASINRRHPEYLSLYNVAGSVALKREVARRAVTYGANLRADEIVITNGGMEAITLALLACTEPGDTVAVESPTYFLLLQMITNLGRKVIEIPTHPSDGLSVDALDLATQCPGAVKAVALVPNFSNPMGCLMPEAQKRRLVALATERNFTVIESDIYGETAHGTHRPPALQGFDGAGQVILCSSFTKILAPGLRVGWMAPGPRWFARVQLLKLRTSMAVQIQPQEAIAAFLHDGGYDHHLRRLRSALRDQVRQMADAVARWFPPGCAFSLPQGGFLLWVELPRHVDSVAVFEAAKAAHVGAVPGAVFSTTRRYDHCLRLQCGEPWSSAIEAGVRTLGAIIAREADRPH